MESCDLRKWLNEEFYAQAFTTNEQRKISESVVRAEKNPKYVIDQGGDVKDYVFLLGIGEAQRYYGSDEERKCRPTEYVMGNNAYVDDDTKCCWWWLHSMGAFSTDAVYVRGSGSVIYCGNCVDSAKIVVRPALWINLNN